MKILHKGRTFIADDDFDQDHLDALRTADEFGFLEVTLNGLIGAGVLTEVNC